MNRYNLMESFLTVIKEFIKSNPKLVNNQLKEFVYAQLITFNLKENQSPYEDISYTFKEWINNFQNSNLSVFVSEKHPGFCTFKNINTTGNEYKIYVPIDSKHIIKAVNELFIFTITNDIKHSSIVSKNIRNDGIIIKVPNFSDLARIIDYINNNMYIKEGIINANPFLINVGIVGISYDNCYSYNIELASAIANLTRRLYSQDRLDLLNVNMLHEYIGILAKKTKDTALQKMYQLQFLATTNKNISLNEFYNKTKPNKINDSVKEFYLRASILETYKKYGSMNQVISAIKKYQQGISNSITKNNSARINLIQNVKPEEIDHIIKNSLVNLNSRNYIKQYVEKVINGEINEERVFNVDKKYKIISDSFYITAKRYNKDQALIALKKFITTGSCDCFTRQNNARENIEQNRTFKNLE